MSAYLKWWRKRKAEVQILAQSSGSDDEENLVPNVTPVNTQAASVSADDDTEVGSEDPATSLHHSDVELDDFGDLGDPSSSDSDTQSVDLEGNPPIIEEQLAAWATKHQCSRAALNEMLEILRGHGHRLPKDGRTLLGTPTRVVSVNKCGGQYIYFGIESGLLRDLSQGVFQPPDGILKLDVNIDGVPLFKSSNIQLWPILCKVGSGEPFMVALFCGSSKPTPVDNYLEDFSNELQELLRNGLAHREVVYQVVISAFICDAPARAFLKCIKGHTAYFACERCTIRGGWNGRIVFNSEEACDGRTQELFNNFEYVDHQVARTPLINIGINCIQQFALDYMHVVCLGVVKRILHFLTRGPNECRLGIRQKTEISGRLEAFAGFMPSEFARQPRSLTELDRWKATEFRQFLLYTGPVVLLNVVAKALYDHFLTFSVGISILLESNDEKRQEYTDYAKELLLYFVHKSKDVYGDTFAVYNVHSLVHLPEDVNYFQCSLNDISAFPFENHLQRIKKLVKKAQNPIVQVARRLAEIDGRQARNQGQVHSVHVHVSAKRKDRCFITKDQNVAFFVEKRDHGALVCDCVKRDNTANFFETPCHSKLINIVFISDTAFRRRSRRQVLKLCDIDRKAVCLAYNDGYVILPLLHGVE